MTDKTAGDETLGRAMAVEFASDLTSTNINKYLKIHNENEKVWKMKILDQTCTQAKKVLAESAKLSAMSLEQYLNGTKKK